MTIASRSDDLNWCNSSPVAFLEGIYGAPTCQHRGIARALIEAGTDWAGTRGASEFASDALVDNHASHASHRATAFAETERVACLRRPVRQRVA